MNKGQFKIPFALSLVYLIWGTSYYAIGVAVQVKDPFLFCGLRFLIAAPILFVTGMLRGEAVPAGWRRWAFNAVSGILLMGVSSGLLAWGQQIVPSSESALIIGTSALWITLLGVFGKYGQPLTGRTWCCLLSGLLGLTLVIETNIFNWQSFGLPYMAILAAALSLAAATMMVRTFGDATNPLTTAASHLFFSGLVLLAIGLGRAPNHIWGWSPEATAALVYVAVFNSSIAVAAYYWLIHRVSPAVLGSFAYVTPALALATGHILGGEQMTLSQISGGILILLAVFVHAFPASYFKNVGIFAKFQKKETVAVAK